MLKKILLCVIVILSVSCENENFEDTVIIDTPPTGPTELVISKDFNEIPLDGTSWDIIYKTMYSDHGNHMYTIGNDRYLLFPGNGYDDSTGEKGSPILFKEIDGEWKFVKIFHDIEVEDIRNFRKIDDTTFLWGGASENNPNTCNCNGIVGRPNNIWLVKVVPDDVIFTQINTETSWFHDISYGDIDDDGLFDVIWAPSNDVYFQNPNGTFRLERDVFPYSAGIGAGYFSIEAGDLFGDSKVEVVKTIYLTSTSEALRQGFIVYQFNETTRKMEEIFRKRNPLLSGDSGGNNTQIIDINNDGFNDLIISREGDSGTHNNHTEIWMGDGTPNLIPTDVIGDSKKFQILNTNLMDVNGDGNLDVVFGSRNGSVRLTSDPWDGFRLNDMIWINDGNGKFSNYTKSELVGGEGFDFGKFIPYMKDGNLTFFGESFNRPENGNARTYINEVMILNL